MNLNKIAIALSDKSEYVMKKINDEGHILSPENEN